MRIMIAGGGTGGHTSPAEAVIEELRRRDSKLLLQWVGCRGNIEERVARRQGIPFRSLPVEGWSRRLSPRAAWTLAKLGYGIIRAWFYLKVFQPQVVLGVGGYVSLPVVWMAQRMGIPTVLHEQNKRMGLANRITAPRATRLFVSYPETAGALPGGRARLVGNPVRPAFLSPPEKLEACARFHLNPDVPVVLISGGSQGARTLNQAAAYLARQFKPGEAQFLWATGHAGFAAAREAAGKGSAPFQAHAFIEDMAGACAAADVIVSRAGASTAAEIAALGKASILIPYPHAADNHQEDNARAMEAVGAAIVLPDAECTGTALADRLRALLADPDRLTRMGEAARSLAHPLAAEHIAEAVMEIVHESGPDAPPSAS